MIRPHTLDGVIPDGVSCGHTVFRLIQISGAVIRRSVDQNDRLIRRHLRAGELPLPAYLFRRDDLVRALRFVVQLIAEHEEGAADLRNAGAEQSKPVLLPYGAWQSKPVLPPAEVGLSEEDP